MAQNEVFIPEFIQRAGLFVFLCFYFLYMIHLLSRALLLLLFIGAMPLLGHTQQAAQMALTTQDGLYQPDVSEFFFDSKGTLWVQYVAGDYISRFDGHHWEHFSKSKLDISSVEYLGETKAGIWWHINKGNKGPLLYDQDGNWHIFPMRGTPIKDSYLGGNIQLIDSTLQVWEYRTESEKFAPKVVLSVQTGMADMKLTEARSLTDSTLVLTLWNQSYNIGQYVIFNTKTKQSVWQSGQISEGIFFLDRYQLWYHGREFFIVANGKRQRLKFSLPDKKNLSLIDYIDMRTKSGRKPGFLVKDEQGEFHVLSLDQYGNPTLILEKIAKNYGQCFTQDNQYNWWYTTTGDALVRNRQGILSFPESQPNMIQGLHTFAEDEKGYIWMGGYSGQGGFTVWNQQGLVRPTAKLPDFQPIMPGAYSDPDGGIFYFADGAATGLNYIQNGKHRYLNAPNFNTTGYLIKKLRNNKLAAGTALRGLVLFNHPKTGAVKFEVIDANKGLKLSRVITFSEDQRGRIWMGNKADGISIYDPTRDTIVNWLRIQDPANRFGIRSSHVDVNDQLWLGSDKGLYRLSNASTFEYGRQDIFKSAQHIALPANDTSLIYFIGDYEKYLVIGSEKAVHLLDKSYRNKVHPRIFSLWYGKDIDGGGSEQNTIHRDRKGFIWIGTQKGAFRLDFKALRFDTTQLTIRLQKTIADTDTISNLHQPIILPVNKRREVSIHWYINESHLFQHDVFFNVFVIRSDGDTLYSVLNTSNHHFTCTFLPPDDYRLVIEAYRHNLMTDRQLYDLIVPRTWFEFPIFWIGINSLLAAIVGTIVWGFRRQNRRIKEDELMRGQLEIQVKESRLRQDQLKVQALSNFLNPHFINNSLAHIQGKLNDPESKAVAGRLAENVRVIYDSTRYNRITHSISREMRLVDNYVLIAKARFGKNIAVNSLKNSDIPEFEHIEIPVLLLQIYVENAVEKGLQLASVPGTLTIETKLSAEGVHICITDDGTGRVSNPYEDRSLKSSTKMMEELIDLLNQYNSEQLIIRYEDKWLCADANYPNPHGTKVHFFIPNQYRYDI